MLAYLDNSSTTRQGDEVTAKMLRHMREDFGNPSSLHGMGIAAENAVKEARRAVSRALGFRDEEVTFTSGGTEAANLALFGAASSYRRRGNRILTSAVEHPAVLESCKKLESMGFEVICIGVDDKCRLDMDELSACMSDDVILLSVMHVNNEVGTFMPIREIGGLKGEGALLHTDAVQSFCKAPGCGAGADIVTVSAHKIHGPKGCGAVAARRGTRLTPMVFGGGQEGGLRPGTENVAAIAGFGKAAEIASSGMADAAAKVCALRQRLLEGIKSEIADIRVNSVEEAGLRGESGLCSPYILNVSFLGVRGEALVHGLESEGVYASTGAACSSRRKRGNHVLAAMGLSDGEAEGALRFSLCPGNTMEEIDYALCKLKEQVRRFRKFTS